mmetsp:Transcript_125842/g.355834  ORF Transcript_125842/g.355834 Transcript_125842/m.355834 type:complete len:401 (-) Transcript_125842:79-1281(-)
MTSTRTSRGRPSRCLYASRHRSVQFEKHACCTDWLTSALSHRLASLSVMSWARASSKAPVCPGVQRRAFVPGVRCSWKPWASAARKGVPQPADSRAQNPVVSMQLAETPASDAAKATATSSRPTNFGSQKTLGAIFAATCANSVRRGPSPTKANVTLSGARCMASMRKWMFFSAEKRPTYVIRNLSGWPYVRRRLSSWTFAGSLPRANTSVSTMGPHLTSPWVPPTPDLSRMPWALLLTGRNVQPNSHDRRRPRSLMSATIREAVVAFAAWMSVWIDMIRGTLAQTQAALSITMLAHWAMWTTSGRSSRRIRSHVLKFRRVEGAHITEISPFVGLYPGVKPVSRSRCFTPSITMRSPRPLPGSKSGVTTVTSKPLRTSSPACAMKRTATPSVWRGSQEWQ